LIHLDQKYFALRVRFICLSKVTVARVSCCRISASGYRKSAASRAAVNALIQPKLDRINMLSFKAFDERWKGVIAPTLEALSWLNLPSRVAGVPLSVAA
jgi:hypothetical protein